MNNQLGTAKDSEELRHKMNYLITQTSQLVKKVTSDFKHLDSIDRGSDKQKKMLKSKLFKEFEITVSNLKSVATIAAQKEKATPVPQRFAVRSDDIYGDDDFEHRKAEESKRLLDEQKFQSVEQERIFQEDFVSRRNQEIKEIEKAVVEVNSMFQDVAQLVAEQGTMIDNIESNVEKKFQGHKDGSSRVEEG